MRVSAHVTVAAGLAERQVASGNQVAARVVAVEEARAVGGDRGREPAVGVVDKGQRLTGRADDAAVAEGEAGAAGQHLALYALLSAQLKHGTVGRGECVL